MARAKGTPMTKGQKRGGLEEQEKHPWCPVEGGGCLLGTEFHRAPPWEDFAVAEKWRGGLSRGCAKPRDREGEPGTRLGGDEGPPGSSPRRRM